MSTVIQLITDSMRLVNIIDENDTPTAEQGEGGLRSLNDLLKDWEEDGIRIGWQTVDDQDDTLPVRERDRRAVKYNFAVELSGEYGIEAPPRVQQIAETTYARLAKRALLHVEVSMSDLPTAEPYANYPGTIQTG